MKLPILIRDAESGKPCQAELNTLVIEDLAAIDKEWKPYLDGKIELAEQRGIRWWQLPQHQGWDWASKIDANADPDAYIIFGIKYDAHYQGLMIVNNNYYAALDAEGEVAAEEDLEKELTIHIDFLSVAPWNLVEFLTKIDEAPRFRSVGRALMQVAVQLSFENGYKGRVGLYALPQAEGFYEKCGMIPIDRDCDHECLCYYELTLSGAEALRGGAV